VAVPDKVLTSDAPETPDASEDRDLAPPFDVACLAPRLMCGDRCVDPEVDRDHCGGCGVRCCAGSSCASGRCRPDCSEEQTACPTSEAGDAGCVTGGSCHNLANDYRYCGACDRRCCLGSFCVRGSCTTGCGAGYTNCPAQPPPTDCIGGICADTLTNRINCGACGNHCAAREYCVDGRCVVSCARDLTACLGVCRDLSRDAAHCGACGAACADEQVCVGGRCRAP
jgi:hypothetical protein